MKFIERLSVPGLLCLLLGCGYSSPEHIKAAYNESGSSIDTVAEQGKYMLAPAFPAIEFDRPVELTNPKDESMNRLFVVAQKGIIHVLPNKADLKQAPVFLDISGQVKSGGEMGLLGLAFHPNYKSNGYFYVNYTKGNPLETIISRFKVSDSDPNKADPKSELILLRYGQPYENHNGGKVAFGKDGYLYIAAGDGGSGGDPGNRAQDRKQYLGKILRIDVNNTSGNRNYAIPPTNPFADNKEGFREEIFAYGMRNPWRFSFDQLTGTLWAGDVGQDKIEEIDIIERGGNYGWHIMEANDCFISDNCDKSGLTLPIWTYRHSTEIGNSITGGFVCRDKQLPGLAGKYLYGDYTSGNIWALTYSEKKAVKNELLTKLAGGLSSFGEDNNGSLYALAYATGKIYRITQAK